MCIHPSNGAQVWYTDLNFDVLKIGCWPPNVTVCNLPVVALLQLGAIFSNNVDRNDDGNFSMLAFCSIIMK
jgi:hypothetical protein